MKNPLNVVAAYNEANLVSFHKTGLRNIATERSETLVTLGNALTEIMGNPNEIRKAYEPAEGVVRFSVRVKYWDKFVTGMMRPALDDAGLNGTEITCNTDVEVIGYDFADVLMVTFTVPLVDPAILEAAALSELEPAGE